MDDVDTRPAAVVDAGSAEAATVAANPSDPYLREAQTFPRLTAEQIGRAAAFGTAEDLAPGTVLFQRGDRTVDFFIVLHGRIEITEPAPDGGDRVITVHAGQQFTGELDLFNDRLILVGGRIGAEGGRVVRMNRAAFRRMLAAEPDIGEVVMRAFILRRVGFIEHGQAGVTLVASRQEGVGDSLRIQRFLGRNGYPVRVLDIGRPGAEGEDARTVLAAHGCGPDDVPVVVCGPGRVLRNPGNAELGAVPNTGWLAGCGVALDERGFVQVGAEAGPDPADPVWSGRPPHVLETSRPGIFAVGDVRAGSVKRVASAVGEGSVVVSSVHQVLAEH